MGTHRKPKETEAKHAKPREQSKVARKVAILGAGAVAVPVTALTFTPSAMAATTQNIPRVVVPAGGDVTTPAVAEKCEDHIVNRGETFSGIARTYGVSLDALKPINLGVIAGDRPDDYSLIFRGGHIHLPDGSCDPKSPPAPTPPAKPTHYWKNCSDARHHGWHDFRKRSSGYRSALDGDHDGIACEKPPVLTPPVVTNPGGEGDGGGTGSTGSDGTYIPAIAPDGPGTASGYLAHSPAYWAPLIDQALSIVGGNVLAGSDVGGIESLMAAESSGDPNAINNYDSNAQNGDPSRGLMQTIGATFNAYHVSGTSTNIYDPLANLCAALNYINDVYGGNIPSSPY